MKVILAKDAGFCFGVNHAVKIIQAALKEKKTIYSIGPFIHNPLVVKEFEKKGLKVIKNISEVESNHKVLIRTHGDEPETYRIIKKNKLSYIETTCPFVKKLQQTVSWLKQENFKIIIIGDKTHPEIKALLGYAKNKAIVIDRVEEIKKITNYLKIGVVVQTTYAFEKFKTFVFQLLNKSKEIRIYNTICEATLRRQKNALNLTKKVDLMLIIGGRNSANTLSLYKLCKQYNKKTYHIEIPEEIKKEWFLGEATDKVSGEKIRENFLTGFTEVKTVGITTGASTPFKICQKVAGKLKSIF